MTQKLLIIYTGGTIGMVSTEHGLAPAAGLANRIQDTLGDSLTDLPEFDVIELNPLIDSSNITPNNWSQIYDTLQSNWSTYAGFIVLHGTDTLAYTASVLSYMLGACDKNVIITGSQIPLGMSRSDGISNLEAALAIAGEESFDMATVLFHHTLMQANRVTKFSSHDFAAFQSFNAEPLAKLSIHKRFTGVQLNAHHTQAPKARDYEFALDSVGVLPLYPSMPKSAYQGFLDDEQCKAVVLHTYGAGNIADSNPDLVAFLEAMQARKKVVINVTQCAHGGTSQGAYAAGSLLNRLSILDGKDITLEAAFTKAHWLLAQGYGFDDIQAKWSQPVMGEVNES
ncbi:L-asparaginase 1 [Marinomonas aquimarina]|uniref:L-asparaginase 1 n=1 Tax=Marinomonas aquimarina TaxID=295068 RepID=A0A1A8TJX2_9GAMM|nr:asparaginase [Marinomonas aquimarina]SBS33181.1 L-asparaginase 1 [Marinomonas aquimarina]